jgi:hypothetical protein
MLTYLVIHSLMVSFRFNLVFFNYRHEAPGESFCAREILDEGVNII